MGKTVPYLSSNSCSVPKKAPRKPTHIIAGAGFFSTAPPPPEAAAGLHPAGRWAQSPAGTAANALSCVSTASRCV